MYVNDNTAGINTIGAFDPHADGTLTPEAGSPFAAGGAGTGAALASQGALQISANGRFLIAVDAGSNQISVLRITPGGARGRHLLVPEQVRRLDLHRFGSGCLRQRPPFSARRAN